MIQTLSLWWAQMLISNYDIQEDSRRLLILLICCVVYYQMGKCPNRHLSLNTRCTSRHEQGNDSNLIYLCTSVNFTFAENVWGGMQTNGTVPDTRRGFGFSILIHSIAINKLTSSKSITKSILYTRYLFLSYDFIMFDLCSEIESCCVFLSMCSFEPPLRNFQVIHSFALNVWSIYKCSSKCLNVFFL